MWSQQTQAHWLFLWWMKSTSHNQTHGRNRKRRFIQIPDRILPWKVGWWDIFLVMEECVIWIAGRHQTFFFGDTFWTHSLHMAPGRGKVHASAGQVAAGHLWKTIVMEYHSPSTGKTGRVLNIFLFQAVSFLRLWCFWICLNETCLFQSISSYDGPMHGWNQSPMPWTSPYKWIST